MSVHQRKDGRWVAFWRENGKQRWKYFGRGDEAKAAAQAFDARRKRVSQPLPPSPTLAELIDLYLAERKPARTTAQGLTNALSYADFADEPVETLTPRHLKALRLSMDGLSNTTKNRYQAYLAAVMSWALNEGYITRHPWAGLKKLKERRRGRPSLADLRAIHAHAEPYLAWAMEVAWYLIVRPGPEELFWMRWEQVDWDRKVVRIRQAKGLDAKEEVKFIPPIFFPKFRARFEEDQAQGFEWVIHRGDGKKIARYGYRTAWLSAKKKAGLADKDIVLYDVRHAAITYAREAGAPLMGISLQAGHADEATTLRHYSHPGWSIQRQAAEQIPPFEKKNEPDEKRGESGS